MTSRRMEHAGLFGLARPKASRVRGSNRAEKNDAVPLRFARS